jgi:outer membrane protein assembly factor BamB
MIRCHNSTPLRCRRLNSMKYKSLSILLVVICSCVLLTGCLPTSTPARGWSAPVVFNGSLYVGAMDGYVVKFKLVNLGTNDEVAKQQWRYPDTGAALTYFYGSPIIVNDYLYVGGYNGKIYAIKDVYDPEESTFSSVLKWEFPSSSNEFNGSFVGDPVTYNGVLYIGSSDQKLYALNISDNDALSDGDRLLWSYSTGGKIWSTPVVYNGTVYIGSFDHKLYALNASTGLPKEGFTTFEAEGAIVSTPIIYNDTLYFGSLDQRFYAIDATTGALKEGFTPFKADNWFWGKAVEYNGSIIAASLGGTIYALDAESGSKLWESTEKIGAVRGTPALVNNLVIVGTDEGNNTGEVYCFNADNGEKVWEYPSEGGPIPGAVHASIVSDHGVVYVHANQKIYAINATTGKILWTASTGGGG